MTELLNLGPAKEVNWFLERMIRSRRGGGLLRDMFPESAFPETSNTTSAVREEKNGVGMLPVR